jgi:catechol 2,3-dioxygenase-like lactoylglutathione lyase family enzyme
MKAACLLCLVSPLVVQTQSAPGAATPPALAATGAYFALSVADLGASTRWYSEKLGLRVVMQLPRQNKTAVTVLEGGGLIVELIQHEDARPLSAVAPGTRDPLLVHGVFKVGVIVADYPATLGTLKARGVEIAYGPFPARGDQRANVIVRDNAGNLIQLFAR